MHMHNLWRKGQTHAYICRCNPLLYYTEMKAKAPMVTVHKGVGRIPEARPFLPC